jgi:hypothetical protein
MEGSAVKVRGTVQTEWRCGWSRAELAVGGADCTTVWRLPVPVAASNWTGITNRLHLVRLIFVRAAGTS